MVKERRVETRRDRVALAEDAGLGRVSGLSVLAGVMCAYGTFVLVLALVAALLRALGVATDFSANDWRRLGTGAGIVVALVLFVAYLFGGYAAGRMARRAGPLHGLLVFVLGLVLAGLAALLGNAVADGNRILANLRTLGIPTSGREWSEIGTVVGLGSLAGMLLGGLLGGSLGERWHGKLLARALDPEVGAEGAARREADAARASAERRHVEAENRVVQATGRSVIDHHDGDRTPGGPAEPKARADEQTRPTPPSTS